jgi:hypothetical protein
VQDGFGERGKHSMSTGNPVFGILGLVFAITGKKQGTKQVVDRTNPHEAPKEKSISMRGK